MNSLTLSLLLLGVAGVAVYACGPCGAQTPCGPYAVAALMNYGTCTSNPGCAMWVKTSACSSIGTADSSYFLGCVSTNAVGKRDVEGQCSMPQQSPTGLAVNSVEPYWCENDVGQTFCKGESFAKVTLTTDEYFSVAKRDDEALRAASVVMAIKSGFFSNHPCADQVGQNSCSLDSAKCDDRYHSKKANTVCSTTLGAGYVAHSASYNGQGQVTVFCNAVSEMAGCCWPKKNPMPLGQILSSNVLKINGEEAPNTAFSLSAAIAAGANEGGDYPPQSICGPKAEQCTVETMEIEQGDFRLEGTEYVSTDMSFVPIAKEAATKFMSEECLAMADGPAEEWRECFLDAHKSLMGGAGIKFQPGAPLSGGDVYKLNLFLTEMGVSAFDVDSERLSKVNYVVPKENIVTHAYKKGGRGVFGGFKGEFNGNFTGGEIKFGGGAGGLAVWKR